MATNNIRGTTPRQVFTPNIDISDAEVIYIDYKQGSNIVAEKNKDDLTFDGEQFYFVFTQKETLKFKHTLPVRVQVRVKFADGSAIASNIIETTAGEILKDGEI